jgi:ferredoxin
MIRKIVEIDKDKCNGCGICITACHEGALQLINGKAELITDSYCDGLGACLPECPTGAIKIIERDADSFDEELVNKNIASKQVAPQNIPCGCMGSHAKTIEKKSKPVTQQTSMELESQLGQWPCQMKLVAATAPYFDNANLLVAADCTAFAYANIHNEFMKGKITIIGCPKLDEIDYAEKLTQILKLHEIKSLTVLRMEVPCCGGIVNAVTNALKNSGKMIPWNVVTISTDGSINSQL